MVLHPIDIAIIVVYMLGMVVVGFIVERRARGGISSYFLGGNKMPWWVLSMSNAASMFDISGTMWLVSLLYRLRPQERVHSLAVAGVQSDLFDGLSVGLAAAVGGHDRRRVDHAAIRRRYRLRGLADQRRDLCAGERDRLHGLRLCRHREVLRRSFCRPLLRPTPTRSSLSASRRSTPWSAVCTASCSPT